MLPIKIETNVTERQSSGMPGLLFKKKVGSSGDSDDGGGDNDDVVVVVMLVLVVLVVVVDLSVVLVCVWRGGGWCWYW